jgi:hypothetical protein
MLVTSKDASWYGLSAERHLGQSINCFVEPSQNMVELEAIKIFFQFLDLVVVGSHFCIMIA